MTARAVSADSCCGSSTISASTGCARTCRGGGCRRRSSGCRRPSRRCSGSSIGRVVPEHQLAAALRARKVELGAEAIAAAVAAVRAALPRDFSAGDDNHRPRLVALPGSTDGRDGESELPDERPTPEDAVIAQQDETALEQATGALKTAIARLPQEIRLYLQYVMSGDGDLAATRHRPADGAAGDRHLPAAAAGRSACCARPFRKILR